MQEFATGKEAYWPQIEEAVASQIEAIGRVNPMRPQTDPQGVLKEAHDAAIRLTGVDTPDAKYERMRKADSAKRLASLNVRSKTGSGNITSTPGKIFDDLGQIYDRMNNR